MNSRVTWRSLLSVRWRDSIRLRHTVILSSMILVIMAAGSTLMIYQQHDTIRESAESRVLALSRMFALMGAAAVLDNLFRIQEAMNQYIQDPRIRQIDVIDHDHMIVASKHQERIGTVLTPEDWLVPPQSNTEVIRYVQGDEVEPLLVVVQPLFDVRRLREEKVVAWLRIISSMEHVRQQEWQAIERMTYVTLALIAAGILGVHVAQRQVAQVFHRIVGKLDEGLTGLTTTAPTESPQAPQAEPLSDSRTTKGELESLTDAVTHATDVLRMQSRALRESRALLQAVVDNTTAVIYVKDLEGRYMLINHQYATLFHVSKERMLGRTDYDLFPRDLAEAFRVNDERVIQAQTPLEMEEIAPHDDGLHTYLSLKFPLRDAGGTPYAVCGISTDITDRKRAHEALEALNASLERKVRERTVELEAARDQALVATKHKSEFLASMSHELRTPLNAVIGFSEVLLERMFGDLNAKQEEYLQDVYSSGRHLLSLINDILDLSKIEAGRVELEVHPFHLPSTIDGATALVRERAVRHRIALRTDVDDRLGECHGDERKIKQVLLNLLSNAIKFTPDGGAVQLTAKLAGDSAHISVSDTGVGIPGEDQPRIFEEFYRAKSDLPNKREGTGLGLSLAKKFVELHRGRIWAQSTVGEGSTFTFTIPLNPAPDEAAAQAPSGSGHAGPDASSGSA